MQHEFVVYIDEAGDDGIGRPRTQGSGGQSHWLVLSAIIVSKDNDRKLPGWRDEVTSALTNKRKRDLHFADLKHDQSVYAAQILGQKPFGAVAILSNKLTIQNPQHVKIFRQKNHLYRYLLRYIFERVSRACMEKCKTLQQSPAPAKIFFSSRGGMDYQKFIQYMRYLRSLQNHNARHPIYWEYLDIESAEPLDHSKRAGLQVADVVASSFFKAVEPNAFGFCEERYSRLLAPRVLRNRDGNALNYGVKPVPNINQMSLTAEQRAFFEFWKDR